MLEHTFHRAEKLIPQKRLFTVISQSHLSYPEVHRQLSILPESSVVVQPENKETGPGLLLPLIHLCKDYPESAVVVFPSDHFIVEEDLFMTYVEQAFSVVEQDPSRLVLLGVKPVGLESEYGYILPAKEPKSLSPLGARGVLRFIEKPKSHLVPELTLHGGLWNTMVMVFRAKTLLREVRSIAPGLHRPFERIWKAIGTPWMMDVVREVYRQMKPVNFSQGVLETFSLKHPSHLLVLPVHGVYWSDWGSEQRILKVLRETGYPLNRLPEGQAYRIRKGEASPAGKGIFL